MFAIFYYYNLLYFILYFYEQVPQILTFLQGFPEWAELYAVHIWLAPNI